MNKDSFIPVNEPVLDGNEKKYLSECIDSGWISSEGPFVKRFETEFSGFVSRQHGIAVTNGTAALDASIEALGIGPGDEVILPSFTIISCIGQIIRAGAKPVLVDSDLQTWNMDVSQIEEKITERTRLIIAVHIFGLPVDMDPILELAKKYDLKVLEDAAQMIGQTYKGAACGSFGDISTFSFYPNKHITTGEGGMIVTNNDVLADECRELRNLCFQSHKRFIHEKLGWNMRMTNIQAALGVAQLERVDEFVRQKRKMGNHYRELLSGLDTVQLPIKKMPYAENIYWVFGLLLKENTGLDAEKIMKKLAANGIGTRPFFYPLHLQPVLRKMGYFKDICLPNSEKLYKYGFYIPSGLALTRAQQERVADVLGGLLA